MSRSSKRVKHKGCINKVYQGVNVALDHEAKTNHIGNFPHILPNQNNIGSVKIGSQRVSNVNWKGNWQYVVKGWKISFHQQSCSS